MMKLARLLVTAVGSSVFAALSSSGCDVQVHSDVRPPTEGSPGRSEDPIVAASCARFGEKFTCSTTPPDQCDNRGLPGGRGWDMCNWGQAEFDVITDPAQRASAEQQRDAVCPKAPGVTCPPPPVDAAGNTCTKAIFGRFVASQPYYGCPGYIAINLPIEEWSIDVNNRYEDCVLFEQIEGLCDLPMEFISPSMNIPDYDPTIPRGQEQNNPGQITSVEFCRALECHDCALEARAGGGFIPADCKNFRSPTGAGGAGGGGAGGAGGAAGGCSG
jgi:hypothetical protein